MKVIIDENRCIGCGTCEGLYPDCFKIENEVAIVINNEHLNYDAKEIAQSCPVGAILVEE